MTIDRMLRRGVFPILPERPLDESEPTNSPTAKVFVVEVGAYSDRYIDAIFTTRELAEAYVLNRQHKAFERDGIKAHQEVNSWLYESGDFGVTPGTVTTFHFNDGTVREGERVVGRGVPQYREVPAETFEHFLKRHTWNEFGDVEEYDIWDVLPVVPEDLA